MPAIDREYVRRLEDYSTALGAIVELLKDDTKRENVDNVTRMLSNMDGSIGEIVKNIEVIKESVNKIGDQNDKILREVQELKKQKEGGGLGNIADVDNKRKILDAVQVIVLIAGGILAIGLAFKLIAPVDFMSVIAIGLALVFISGAFVAVSKTTKDLEPGKARQTMGLMILMAGAITISSWLLALSATITLSKSLSIIMMTATLGGALFLMSKAIESSKLEAKDYPKMLLLPLVLPLIAGAIALSSYFLSTIAPMSIMQAITTVFVAGAMGLSLYLISNSLEKTKMTDAGKFLLLPLLLPAIAAGLVGSSLILQFIKPISFAQMASTVFVALAIGVAVFFMKPIIQKLEGITLKSVLATGLLMVAIAGGIVASSHILGLVRYLSLREAIGLVITSIAIGISTLAMAPVIMLLKKMDLNDIARGSRNVIFIAGSIAASSLLLSLGRYDTYPDWKWAIGVGLSMIAFSGAALMIDKMGKTDSKKMVSIGLMMVGIASTIMLTSLILSIGNYDKHPTLGWAMGVGASMLAFGGAMYLLSKKSNPSDFIKGGLIAVGIAGAIVLISYILGAGNYKKYPTLEWGVGVGLSLLAFGGAVMLLGKMNPASILMGSVAALLVAGAIVVASHILALGQYKNYPSLDWVAGVGLAMITFGGSMALLGMLTMATAGLGLIGMAAGALAMGIIAATIVSVSSILAGGVYSGGPSLEWSLGTGALLLAVGLTSGAFALLYPLIKLGSLSMRAIAETIADVSHILQKGDYKGGPTKSWAEGVSMSIKAFAEGSAALSGGIIGGLINKLFGIDQTAIIEKIAQSMVDASHILQKGNWNAYPSEEWSKGVGNSVMAFATAIQALDEADIDSGKEFSTTISYITRGIIQAAIDLAKFDWSSVKNYPSEEWSTAVGSAINAFAKPLAELAENDITGREIKTGIKRLAGGMVEAAKILGSIDWNKYDKIYPSSDWVEGVGKALETFVKHLIAIEKNDIGRGDVNVLNKTINAMIYSATKFRLAELTLNGLWQAGPTSDWSSRVGESIRVFVDYLTEIEKNGIGTGDLKVLNKTIDTMLSTARRFKLAELIFKDIWNAGPSLEWSEATGEAIGTFVKYLEKIESSDLDKSDLKVLNSTIDSMISTAYRFMWSELLFKGIWQAGPNSDWVQRTGSAISLFVDYLERIESSGANLKDLKVLNDVVGSIISAAYNFRNAQLLYKDIWSSGPPIEWVMSTGLAISAFVEYLTQIQESGAGILDLSTLQGTIGGIVSTAVGFKLAENIYPGLWNTGPDEAWVNNIGNAISTFVKHITDINKYGIGILDILALQRIINAMSNTATALGDIQWQNGSSLNWINSIGVVIDAFLKNIISVTKNDFSGSDNIKYNRILNTIITTFDKLKDVKEIGFKDNWAKSTGDAILSMTTTFEAISKKEIDFRFNAKYNNIIDAIIKTFTDLKDISSINFKKEWVEGVGEAISIFTGYLERIERSDISGKETRVLDKTIDSIIKTATKLSGVSDISITPKWSEVIGSAIGTFVNHLEEIEKSDIGVGDLKILNKTIDAIIKIATQLKNVDFTLVSNEWLDSTGKAIGIFVDHLEEIEKSDIGGADLKILNKTIDAIIKITTQLKDISATTISSEWLYSTGKAIYMFVKQLEEIGQSDIGIGDLKILDKTIDAIIKISSQLEDVKYTPVSNDWLYSTGKAIYMFVKQLEAIEKSDIGVGDLKILNKTIDAIIKITTQLRDINEVAISSEWLDSTGKAIGIFVKHLEIIDQSKIGSGDLRSLDKIINSIIKISSGLSGVKLDNISSDWLEKVGSSIGLFVKYLEIIEKSDIGKRDTNVLKATLSAINEVSKTLSGVKQIGDLTWLDVFGKTVGLFVNQLVEIEKNDIDRKDLRTLSLTIKAIKLIADQLSNVSNVSENLEWIQGIGKALNIFSMDLLRMENIPIKDVKVFETSLNALVKISTKLEDLKQIEISPKWISSIGSALTTFIKYLEVIESSDIKSSDMKILNGTIDAIIRISDKFKGQNLSQGPSAQWTESVGNALSVFVNYLSIIENQNIGRGDTAVLNKTVDGIVRTALKFSLAEKISPDMWKSGPSEYWTDSVGKALSVFVKHLSMIDEMNIRNLEVGVLNNTVDSIVDTAFRFYFAEKIFGKGLWQTGPSLEWATSVATVVSKFASHISLMENSDISSRDIRKLDKVVGAIIDTAERYHKIETSKPGVWKAGPSLEWALGVSKTITAFAQASVIVADSKNLAGIDGLGEKMLSFTAKLEKAITGKKVFGRGGLFEIFAQSIKNLSSSFGQSNQMASGLNQFAQVLVKISSMGTTTTDSIKMLTKSITQLSDALEDVDMESIDKLSKFSNGILVLSLIDEEKFEKSLEVLQSKKNDIISILSNNSTIKNNKQPEYGVSRVQVTASESKESKDFYAKALVHMSKLDSNVGKMLDKISAPTPQPNEVEDEISKFSNVEPSKATSKP